MMAEGAGFEPAAQGLPVHGISSAAPSAARSPLRVSARTALRVLRPNVERRRRAPPLRRQIQLAEGRGFEPPRDLRPYPISSRTPSTGLGHPSAHSTSAFKEPSQQRRALVGEYAARRRRSMIQP